MIYDIRDVIDSTELEKLIDSFVLTTGMNAMFISADEKLVIRPRELCSSCEICKLISHSEEGLRRCMCSMSDSGHKAIPIGEPYIAICHAGLIEIYSPILYKETYIGVLACGPVLLWELDDIAKEDILRRLSDLPLDKDLIISAAENVNVLNERRIMAAANMMYVIVNYIVKTGMVSLMQQQEINAQQMRIADMLIERKRSDEAQRRYAAMDVYPIGKERELLALVRIGDKAGSTAILNELLSLIFYNNGGNMDIIKSRVLELVVVISRAAVEGGAELENLLGLNYSFIGQLSQIKKFEDLCLWVVKTLNMFVDTVYNARTVKNTGVLADALELIRSSYQRDITLSDVAEAIHISPYYLSHIFKEELGFTFLEYLTNVRMEYAKQMLVNTKKSITDIAQSVGYNDAGYFSKVFKKQCGVTPNAYRKSV